MPLCVALDHSLTPARSPSLSLPLPSSSFLSRSPARSPSLRYDTAGATQSFQSFSSGGAGAGAGSFKPDAFKALKDVVDENLGMQEKPDYFSTRATVTYVKGDNLSYPACPTDRCNKKMSQEGERQWRCEKCEMTYEAPQYRCVLLSPSPSLFL